ncbi:MAG TPA: 30S ribosomal protein S17 [Terriglobales bacterium]|nr:30S ribosomal protein S17 [Terriglobales bacterium]
MPLAAATTENPAKTGRATKVGEVVSTKMEKTIVVEVTMKKAHPLYKRVISRSKKFYVHDEENKALVGDVVRIEETRPMSKLKRWRLTEVVRRSALAATIDAEHKAQSKTGSKNKAS